MAAAIERVLVLDDNDGTTLFWEMLLPEFKLTVFKARTGAEGIQIVEAENIQLAIAAWELRSMPGTVFVQKARGSRKRKRMPFLLYSTRMSPEDVMLAKELGLDNIVPMPLDKSKAREMLKEILDRENNIPPLENRLRKMEDALAEGRPTEALRIVTPDMSKKGPHLARYKTLIGETFLMSGNLEKSEKGIREALEADPNYLPAKYLLARLYTTAGKHDEAIEVLNQLKTSSPRNVQTLISLGSAYVSADKIEEAKKTVSQVKMLDPDNETVKDNEGKIALKEGNLSLAAQLLSETENGDEIARFYNTLGISLVAKGEHVKGIETYLSALKILANKAKLHLLFFNLALAYRKKGDNTNSLSYLCESYINEPAFEKSYAAIARAVAEMKEKGHAINMAQIKLVKDARSKFLTENPQVAEKIKARMDEAQAKGKAS